MNEEKIQNLIAQRMEEVPQAIRDYLKSDSFPSVLRDLIANHNLHIDTAYDVEVQTYLLLLGYTKPEEYVDALVHKAGLNQKTANQITAEMNEKVFKPIMESYSKEQGSEEKKFENNLSDNRPAAEALEGVAGGEKRAPGSDTPKSGGGALEKKYVVDPYREPLDE